MERGRVVSLFHEDAVFVDMGGAMPRTQELDVIQCEGIHYKQADIHGVSANHWHDRDPVKQIRLIAVVGGNEVTNPFVVTEAHMQQSCHGSSRVPFVQ
jgi:hypothetical protein